MLTQDQIAALRAPFPVQEVHWRAGATNKEGTKALALAYIDARAVLDRLDEVVGPMNWADCYDEWRSGSVKAGIGIRDSETGEWVWKFDGADDTSIESTKGGFSDSLKRAAVRWGVGRYLYQLAPVWVPCQKVGNTVKLLETPSLPDWALPLGGAQTSDKTEEDVEDPPKAEGAEDAPKAESVEDTPAEESVEDTPAEEASAPAYWKLANEALRLGISHDHIRRIAHSANGEGWLGAMARLREDMARAA